MNDFIVLTFMLLLVSLLVIFFLRIPSGGMFHQVYYQDVFECDDSEEIEAVDCEVDERYYEE